LQELTDFLEENLCPEERAKLQQHIDECPNCWVLADTTRRTVKIYRECQPVALPDEVQNRLMKALERKMQNKC
jgi:hypothetical protein